jgi:hypothetical protein
LDLDSAAHGVDHTAIFDDETIASALDDPAAMNGNCGIDEIAAQGAQAARIRSSSMPASRL